MEEITIIGENRVGLLAQIAEMLGGEGVNIESISAHGQDDKAIIKLITNDVNSAIKRLSSLSTIEIKHSPILVVELINRPGELGKITRKLANRGINLESVYVIGSGKDFLKIAIKPSEEHFEKAKEIITK